MKRRPKTLWCPRDPHARSPLEGLADAAPDLRLTKAEQEEAKKRAEEAARPFIEGARNARRG